MPLDLLLAEGRRLARPHHVLSRDGAGERVGYWRGQRQDRPNGPPPGAGALNRFDHLLTLDEDFLRRAGLDHHSPWSLFEIGLVQGDGGLRVERAAPFAETVCDGAPLYATSGRTMAPFEAVCLYGDARVGDWLKSLGLERWRYAQARAETAAQDYEDAWMETSPFHQAAGDVIVGGWHFIWPDDDFFMPLEMRLMLTVLADAEPFWEVWRSEIGNLLIKERVT